MSILMLVFSGYAADSIPEKYRIRQDLAVGSVFLGVTGVGLLVTADTHPDVDAYLGHVRVGERDPSEGLLLAGWSLTTLGVALGIAAIGVEL